MLLVLAGALPARAAAFDAGAPDPDAVARGAAIVASRTQGLCVLCHALPGQAAAHQGTIGPPLAGIGARLWPDALRARLLAPERFNPETVMPAYGRTEGLHRVAAARQGQPLLTPAQVDDVVAWLAAQR
jgi:sulfur-oxidizing protein SoxX